MSDAPGARTADRVVEPLFLERWSPRAFDGSAIGEEDLATVFEAARWAPSAFNMQPWRFLYAHRETPDWTPFLENLVPFNQSWVQHASVLIYALSDSLMDGAPGDAPRPSHSHSFDTGAAWALLALQATRLGLHAHGLTGVDFDKAGAFLGVPGRYRIEAAIAVGRQGDKAKLPEPLRTREVPSGRSPVSAFAFHGRLPAPAEESQFFPIFARRLKRCSSGSV